MSFETDRSKVLSRQLGHQTVYFEVCVSEEYLHILVTGDEGHFRTILKNLLKAFGIEFLFNRNAVEQ